MRQTWAMFVDAYRELNHRKMFWISLAISAVVVGAFACLGINERGITVLWKEFQGIVNTDVLSASAFYKILFVQFGVGTWLGLGAMALALVSTASIMPDFVTAGSVELTLSRPISRLRLFVTKYIMAMLFVVAQVTVFTVACILVIGLRGGEWIWGLLLAVPMVTLMFSYLFCVSVLVGVATRSAVTAVLAVAVFWVVVMAVHSAEVMVLGWKVDGEALVRVAERDVQDRKAAVDLETQRAAKGEAGARTEAEIVRLKDGMERAIKDRAKAQDALEDRAWWHRVVFAAKIALPKVNENATWLEQQLTTQADKDGWFSGIRELASMQAARRKSVFRANSIEVMRETDAIVRDRGWIWAIGTSLLFEAAIIGAAAWVFCRRDF